MGERFIRSPLLAEELLKVGGFWGRKRQFSKGETRVQQIAPYP